MAQTSSSQPIALPIASNSEDWMMSSSASYRQAGGRTHMPTMNDGSGSSYSERMRSGSSSSYMGGNGSTSGSFNPASYTRQFLGSPLSWRAGSGSFGGGRFTHYASGSPGGQLLNSLSLDNEFKMALSASMEGDRSGSMLSALNVFDREADLCRNYTCCGQHLTDLHALIEHFEEEHIVVDHNTATTHQVPFHPQPVAASAHNVDMHMSGNNGSAPNYFPDMPQQSNPNSQPTRLVYPGVHEQGGTFDPDDMELELDVEMSNNHNPMHSMGSNASSTPSSSPPETPISMPHSGYASPQMQYDGYQQQQQQLPHTLAKTQSHSHLQVDSSCPPSVGPLSPVSAFETMHVSSRPHTYSSNHHNHHHPNNPVQSQQSSLISAFTSQQTDGGISTINPFNGYSRYSDYNGIPGTVPVSHSGDVDSASENNAGTCVPPELLYSASNSPQPHHLHIPQNGSTIVGQTSPVSPGSLSGASSPTIHSLTPSTLASALTPKVSSSPSSSRKSTAVPADTPSATAIVNPAPTPAPSTGGANTRSSTTLPRPASSLLLAKPFRCPKPNCNKSYKQANGLKYHMTHGSCNFSPPKDLEQVQALLASKRRSSAEDTADESSSSEQPPTRQHGTNNTPSNSNSSVYGDLASISENDLREVEREAEKQMRPFACGVGECSRRYKNMNGLRYHYAHSGDHGAVGLALLASGHHESSPIGTAAGVHSSSGSSSSSGSAARKERRDRGILNANGSSSGKSSRASSMSRGGTPVPHAQPTTFPVAPGLPPSPQHQQQFGHQVAYAQQYQQHQRHQYQAQIMAQQQYPTVAVPVQMGMSNSSSNPGSHDGNGGSA